MSLEKVTLDLKSRCFHKRHNLIGDNMQKEKLERKEEMIRLRANGLSLAEISRKFFVSRARVWQIFQGSAKSPNAILRVFVMDTLGNKCSKCGFDDSRALQIDHIHGGGTQQKKELGLNNPHKYYRYLAEMDISELRSNYQILCANCNWIKRMENNEH